MRHFAPAPTEAHEALLVQPLKPESGTPASAPLLDTHVALPPDTLQTKPVTQGHWLQSPEWQSESDPQVCPAEQPVGAEHVPAVCATHAPLALHAWPGGQSSEVSHAIEPTLSLP